MGEDRASPGAVDRVRIAIAGADTFDPAKGERKLDAGTRLRQYELIRELGRGGMGQVFLARDIKLARRVAIKFLSTASRDATERFLAEARTTAAVNHENIVVIHEVDEQDGAPHMVLEYLEGMPLRELMRGKMFAPSKVIELMVPVVRAVARAHQAGVVHRDLKPENVIVTVDGAIKVLDFGIAKALHGPDVPGRKVVAEDLAPHISPNTTTKRSAVIGTPQYMAPEQFGVDGAIDHRADLWALGVIMFELLVGRHPLAPYTIVSLLTNATELDRPMPKLGSVVHDLPERLERIVDRCLAKRKTARYPDAPALLADLEALMPGRYGRKLAADESPYPGLVAFQEDDADRFFGRSRDVARMTTRLIDQPLVGIAGPSGIGKSSFVRAGVVPALKASGEAWESYILRPGRQPLQSLAGVLAPLTRTHSLDGTRESNPNVLEENEGLVERLTAEPGYLGTLLRERAAKKNTKILLFVDQFEELYTLVADPEERRVFTSSLAGAADDPTSPIRIVVSMRSDFLDRVGEDRRFLDELTRGLVFLQPLGRPELCEALTRPLDMLGYDFENDELVDKMLDELTVTPGALPLLQFAASKLWDARDRKNKILTRAAHDAMGGVSGALASHADDVLAALPAASHKLVRAVLVRLVTPERTRAIVDLAELRQLGDVTGVIDHLVQARLLVVQTAGDAEAGTVEIVHESLLASWPTLRRWLDESQDHAAFLAQLRTAAKQWDGKGRPQGLLWRGDSADEARHFNARYRGDLPPLDRAFLTDVIALATRATRIKRAVAVGVMAFLALVATGAVVLMQRARAAEQVAADNAQRAEAALAQQIAEEKRRHAAEQARTEAIAALMTEEQLRAAAEAGLLDAKQLADIAELKRRAAEKARAQAEAGMATMQAQLRKAEAESKQHATEAQLTREELLAKNQQLETALADAKSARATAERASAEAAKATAKLQQLLSAEQAHVQQLETQRKKITTDLK